RAQSTDAPNIIDTAALSDAHAITESYLPTISTRVFGTSAAHGTAVGEWVAFYVGDRIIALSRVLAVPTSSTFTVPLADVAGDGFYASHVVFSGGAALRYVNGPKACD